MIDLNENLTPENEEEEAHIYLTDESGKEYPFDLLDIIPCNDEEYAIFYPADETEEDDSEDTEVVILKIIHHEDDSMEFEGIDDEEILDTVFHQFMENMRQAFEESEEDEHGCGCGHCHD